MGKKQHQKDKLYLTTTEWRETYGGCKDDVITKALQAKFKRLPFTHCCISLQPFEDPICSPDGHIFDFTHIVPYLKKYGFNPVTGEKLDAKSLVKLHFHKNNDGEYHCPVTYRVFTNTSHIVAIRTTGNVYAYEAIEELNLKPKNFKDLLSDEPFTRKDIITLQDPHQLEKFNISEFYHVKHQFKLRDEAELEKAMSDPNYFLKSVNAETKETLSQLKKDYIPSGSGTMGEKASTSKSKADSVNAAHYSTGMVAAGLTSTTMEPLTVHEAAVVDERSLRYDRVKKKGYVRLVTNYGPLNLELHCDQTPKACENFIQHCRSGYYKGTVFHRLIKNFMVQGGDPTGTGTGGDSIFGKPFEDEFKNQFTHNTRGILSMANKGTNTNTSQFFITFRPCTHLDRKHTIFGRVVGGLDSLTAIEMVKTDNKDKPLEKIEILDTQVFVDPFEEADKLLKEERTKASSSASASISGSQNANKDKNAKPIEFRKGIGKYIAPKRGQQIPQEKPDKIGGDDDVDDLTNAVIASGSGDNQPKKKKLKIGGGFGNFSAW